MQKQVNDYIIQKAKKATKDYYLEEYRTPIVDNSVNLFFSYWSTADYHSLRCDKYYDWLHDGNGLADAKKEVDFKFSERKKVIGDNATIDNFSEIYAYLIYEEGTLEFIF